VATRHFFYEQRISDQEDVQETRERDVEFARGALIRWNIHTHAARDRQRAVESNACALQAFRTSLCRRMFAQWLDVAACAWAQRERARLLRAILLWWREHASAKVAAPGVVRARRKVRAKGWSNEVRTCTGF
jgi:hypothetical protein